MFKVWCRTLHSSVCVEKWRVGFTLHEVVKEDEEKGEQRQVKKERKKETRKGRGGALLFLASI